MKRLLMLILCLLLLSGCGAPADSGTTPTADTPIATEAPKEPAGLYDPESELEARTGGAVRAYPLNRTDTQCVVPFGSDLLLLNTGDTTTLTRLTGNNLHPVASVTLDCVLFPADPSLQASAKGVTYFDAGERDLVFLDTSLREVSRYDLPDEILGYPALSADRKQLYYFTADALRAIDLDSSIDRLVRQMSYANQSISKLHWNDTVVECQVSDEKGATEQLFLRVSTGELIAQSRVHLDLATAGACYFVTRMDGAYQEILTGTAESDIRMLHYPEDGVLSFPLLQQGLIITGSRAQDTLTLNCYRLEDGTRPYSLTLTGDYSLWSIIPTADGSGAWLLIYSDSLGSDLLCRWNYEGSAIDDDTVYIGNRRTPENPDEFGLESCAALAKELSSKHGVQILIWKDAVKIQPEDYSITAEHQVPMIRDALTRLDAALSHYPESFLTEAVSEMGDGILRIGLVRDISGITDSGSPDSTGGLQFWESSTGNAYVLLGTDGAMEQNLYHELFHIIESRIFSKSLALDDWEKLNPKDFSYDYSYLYYKDRTDHSLTEGETRAFIDFYSMTFPKEDRARVMQYAMLSENADCFLTDTMQQKLLAICRGIREAYGLKEYEGSLLWEQYLAEPIR